MLSEIPKNIAIKVSDVGKCYRMFNEPIDRLKQAVFRNNHYCEESWVLRDINFELERGKALGVIGKNGAGKSTLLQILTGVLTPTTGEVFLRGKIAALLELGSGFNPEFSGRDNIYVNGSILGLTRRQIDDRFDEIVNFSELGDAIGQPVKTYSSGMYVRLAFSVQVCINPHILIVDEALAVGDAFFQQKCHARMEKLLDNGTAILLVSHDTASIRKYCDTALLLEDGKNVFYGDVEVAVSKYISRKNKTLTGAHSVSTKIQDQPIDKKKSSTDVYKVLTKNKNLSNIQSLSSIGSKKLLDKWPESSEFIDLTGKEVVGDEYSARFKRVALCDDDGISKNHFTQGELVYFFWELELLRDFQVPIGGLTIFTSSNLPLFCRGTIPPSLESLTQVKKGNLIRFYAVVKMDIAVDNYIVKLSFAQMEVNDFRKVYQLSSAEYLNSVTPCIQIPKALTLNINENNSIEELPFLGFVDLPNSFEMKI